MEPQTARRGSAAFTGERKWRTALAAKLGRPAALRSSSTDRAAGTVEQVTQTLYRSQTCGLIGIHHPRQRGTIVAPARTAPDTKRADMHQLRLTRARAPT